MNYDKYIGKGWSYSYKDGMSFYYIIDVKIVNVNEYVVDENGRAVFVQVPYKKGGGSKSVIKTETVKRPAILAIQTKYKYGGSTSRYSITNPTAQYAMSDQFFEKLKRDRKSDKLIYDCLKYLFEMGFDKWKKRYQGYRNLVKD